MEKLNRAELWSLEDYAVQRPEFRKQVIDHKRRRQVPLGQYATLHFEDFLTMKYQVQEMLRIERIFGPKDIQAEIDTYNPLIPDGANWKATLMIEYPDVAQRRQALERLKGVERRVWAQAGQQDPKLFAIANEDLDRSNEEKTAAVHFLRFELNEGFIHALRQSGPLRFGINHAHMRCAVEVVGEVKESLIGDLD